MSCVRVIKFNPKHFPKINNNYALAWGLDSSGTRIG